MLINGRIIKRVWPEGVTPVGTLFSDSFNRSSPGSNYTVSAADVTFSQNSTYLRAARATTGGFANYMSLNYPTSSQGLLQENLTMKLIFRIVTSSVGIGIGWKSLAGNSAVDFTGILVTGASGYGSRYHNGSEIDGSSGRTTLLATANGNQVSIEIVRSINQFVLTVALLNGSGGVTSSVNKAYTFSTTGSPLAPSVSQPTIYFLGGTYDLESFTVSSQMNRYGKVAFVGDSITQWYFASVYTNRYANEAMTGSTFPYYVLAGQGQRTAEILKGESEILLLRPRYVVLMIGTNDIGTGVADATWQANYSAFVEFLLANAIKPVLCYLTPRNSYDFRPTTTGSPNKWIADTYGSDGRVQVVDTYTPLKDGSGNGISATYSTDGLHPNDAGMALLGTTLQSAIPYVLGV